MFKHLTPAQTQALHKIVTSFDYQSLFPYHSYRLGMLAQGSWMIAKAIHTLVGGELYQVAFRLNDTCRTIFIQAAVKLDQDTFIDGQGLHTIEQLLDSWSGLYTSEQLLEPWSHLQLPEDGCLTIEPLFFLPDQVEDNAAVVEQLVWTIEQQLRLQWDVGAVDRLRRWLDWESGKQALEATECCRWLSEQSLEEEEHALLCSAWEDF
ncbi:hypothetical protein H6F76_22640 [Leptolyngbya sp. FACHB-321]|uniref:hypothetical protein n=1 Tax=Leptolyngbya sp. FACHB-321 TaxID=2692807 RepID=UPI0016888848|nr:hypothetical protein [Leptolyngbya sp. FACHB-321]MBD2037756.1 hypothetical protein [Leptolyngbya sp. FACHB-321]